MQNIYMNDSATRTEFNFKNFVLEAREAYQYLKFSLIYYILYQFFMINSINLS